MNNNKIIISMYKCDKVIGHHIEISIEDAEKMLQLLVTGFNLVSITHVDELNKSYEKVRNYMSSLDIETHDAILEKYYIEKDMSFEEVMNKFGITDYKVYSNEEFFSKFGHEDKRAYFEKYPVNSELQYRYNPYEDCYEIRV